MTAPVPQPSNWFPNAIGLILVTFLCSLTTYLTVKLANIVGDVPPNLAFVCGQLLGFLTAKLSTMVDWGFGGSSGQKTTRDIIATQATTIASAQDKLAPVPGAPTKAVSLGPDETAVVHAEGEVKS